jgi:hypothetical protein
MFLMNPLFSCILLLFSQNIFEIDFQKKGSLNLVEYAHLEQTLHSLDLQPLLSEFYQRNKLKDPHLAPEIGFLSRTLRATKAKFIDVEKNLEPYVKLEKINDGGDLCIVSSIPLRVNYPEMLTAQIEGLKKTGFNGYHLSFFGAYPNPTGIEYKYSGVPYAMKVFALLEAQRKGFKKVVWMDSSLVPQKNITPLFKNLKTIGAIYTHHNPNGFASTTNTLLPQETKDLLQQLTGQDATICSYVVAMIMGFYVEDPLFKQFIDTYYDFVKMGTPFLSLNPEEYVITAILAQPQFKKWYDFNNDNAVLHLDSAQLKKSSSSKKNRNKNKYFLQIDHKLAYDVFKNQDDFNQLAEGVKRSWITAIQEDFKSKSSKN